MILLDDVLGDPDEAPLPHPHRRTLHWQPTRRAGSVTSHPAHCISPVRRRSGALPERARLTRI
ncbi:MAG: hypothetical protein ACJ764_15010 [Solirubrobacteraceae bacterium]